MKPASNIVISTMFTWENFNFFQLFRLFGNHYYIDLRSQNMNVVSLKSQNTNSRTEGLKVIQSALFTFPDFKPLKAWTIFIIFICISLVSSNCLASRRHLITICQLLNKEAGSERLSEFPIITQLFVGQFKINNQILKPNPVISLVLSFEQNIFMNFDFWVSLKRQESN